MENIPVEYRTHFENEIEEISNCCGAKIMLGDICSDCKEHCGTAEVEND